MALSLSITKFGITFQDAYHKVETVITDKNNGITVAVFSYSSQASREAGDQMIDSKTITFPYADNLVGTNPIAQAYDLLLSTPEFAGAVTV